MSDASPTENKDKKPAPKPAASRPRRSFAWLLAALALLLALMALGGTAYTYWRLRAVEGARRQAAAALQAVDRQRTRGDALAQQLDELGSRTATAAQLQSLARQDRDAANDLGQRVTALENQIAHLKQQLGGRQAGTRISDAIYLVRIARHQAHILHDRDATIAALTAALKALAAVQRPAVQAVREQLSGALTELNAAPPSQAGSIAQELANLATRIDSLPLRPPVKDEADKTPTPPAAAPKWWQRIGNGLSRAFHELVTVHHAHGAAAPLLAPKQRYFLYRNLSLQLDAARVAALEGDRANFRASIERAHAWLTQYFDVDADAVKAALAELAAMHDAVLQPQLPDLAPALNALEHLQQGGA